MALLWRSDESLSKRDDDLVLPGGPRPWPRLQSTRVPRRRTLARLVAYALALFILLFLLRRALGYQVHASTSHSNLHSELYGSDDIRPPRGFVPPDPAEPPSKSPLNSRPKPDHQSQAEAERPELNSAAKQLSTEATDGQTHRDYTGKLHFPSLAKSLITISNTGGSLPKNRNVLFAAASVESISTLLPMACQMASERQNYVHFAILSRSELPVTDLLKVNGIQLDDQCPVIVHDARPDSLARSTELRMILATVRAFFHMHVYMHPQALIIDSSRQEESYLVRGTREQCHALGIEVIELPDRPGTRFSWLAKLDAAALTAWNRLHLDILVHAPRHGSGNLQRLLRSLSQADLGAVGFPQLTIELPPIVEAPTETFLAGFRWPPPSASSPNPPNLLSLRHRIPRKKLTEEESSVQFLESFWPVQPADSHVLVLSPDVEVTPQFLSYVKYAILHHRYSNVVSPEEWRGKMMALSFAVPNTLLDGSQPLAPPREASAETVTPASTEENDQPFLWQGPASKAMVIAGDRWVELHGYVSQLLEHQGASPTLPALLAKKEVSKKYPSWLEHLLQISRLRGYFTVYPGRKTVNVLLGVHNDLSDAPEEYEDEVADSGSRSKQDVMSDGNEGAFNPKPLVDVVDTLPQRGTLPFLQNLPLLSWDGRVTTGAELSREALEYAQKFRQEVGGCKSSVGNPPLPDKHARDLFCDGRS